jgi:hypothetical protein
MITFDEDRRLREVFGGAEAGYLTAQVCTNGHPITSSIEHSPELIAKFCATCGAATRRACDNCAAPIQGEYYVPGVVAIGLGYTPPNHCHNCGAAFSWTKAKLAAAKEHALEIDGLDEREKAQLQGTIDDLAAGGARTELAVSRFKRLMKKAGQTVGSGFYKVAIDLASEAAKKALIG